ncbi:GntR family transcriptional regulator [Streptantibioticus silvisoli]|uniref:GntR family transcriptional regulator n=1 Tax=Streptantibioticus silvisoli TaxID=2705255 RepID=A0ABT6W4T5_9ACTN|nr:GntR family transcriptional regulator [Streptantibioticus silvisoli]MDI5965767.1 GntR family transcriptional regulator [Streptantibioticus silvisoli]
MAGKARGDKPRYQQIADELRAKIQSGAYEGTRKLPSEREMSEQYGVARNTVRDALQVLRSEDLIETRRGSGVHLRSFRRLSRDAVARASRSQWGAGRSIWDHDTGPLGHQETTQVEKIDPPAPVAGVLGVRGQKVWRRSRLHRVDKRTVMKSTGWYPADLAEEARIAQPDTGPGGVYARLDEIGHGPARYREEIEVRLPLSDEVADLGITQTTPILRIVRTAYDSDDRPVEVNEMVMDSDSYRLIYTFPS